MQIVLVQIAPVPVVVKFIFNIHVDIVSVSAYLRGARNLSTDTFATPNGHLDPNGHPNPIAQKLRVLLMHLGFDGSRLVGVSWCSSARYRAADHHHHHRHHHHKKKSNVGWAVVRMPIAKIPKPTAKGLVLGYVAGAC